MRLFIKRGGKEPVSLCGIPEKESSTALFIGKFRRARPLSLGLGGGESSESSACEKGTQSYPRLSSLPSLGKCVRVRLHEHDQSRAARAAVGLLYHFDSKNEF